MDISKNNFLIGRRIKDRREELNLSQEELAHKIGSKNRSTVSNYEQGSRSFKQSQIVMFAKALDTTPAYLMGWEETEPTPTPQLPKNLSYLNTYDLPLLGSIAAGQPHTQHYEYDDSVSIPSHIDADFALTVSGDSMEPVLSNGDIVYVKKTADLYSGQIVVVSIDGDATVKYYQKLNGNMILQPVNLKYPPIIITKDTPQDIFLVGKAVAYWRKL